MKRNGSAMQTTGGWTAIVPPGGRKPSVSSLGPYREPAVGAGAALVRQWRSTTTGSIWFLTLFAILWNGILTAMIVNLLGLQTIGVNDHTHSSWGEVLRHDPWIGIFVVFPLIGIVVGYVVVATWINHTRIDLTSNTLIIRRGPLPWRGRFLALPVSAIQQLYVQEYVSHEENDQPATAFRVMARLTDGRDLLVDRGMKVYNDARALEQWIEKRLGI
jgi:hypothetical protein